MLKTLLLTVVILTTEGWCRPNSFVTTPPPSSSTPVYDDYEDIKDDLDLNMAEFHVKSDIQLRYAKTVVETYLKNPNVDSAKELAFTMVIPDSAFISNFSMILKGQEFVAEVKEKDEAQEIYEESVNSGQVAGIVKTDAREANKITVSVNVEPLQKVRFRLVYEELLLRKIGRYEHIIHVNPGQLVKDFRIDVFINESLPVTDIKVPELKKTANDITSSNANPLAKIDVNPEDEAKVHISYYPSVQEQKAESDEGVGGQFIIQYDVDRKGQSSDIQVLDGYFVHFFAPDNLETLPRHVIFVLDISGSMTGLKLQQTKDAMITILDDMTDRDYFNILTFSNGVSHWVPENEKYLEGEHSVTYPGSEEIKDEALNFVLDLRAGGGTNINSALLEAMELATRVKQSEQVPANTNTIVIFLTDGEATSGVTNSQDIRTNVANANEDKVAIYGLAFGSGADFGLIKSISMENHAFARRIYEGADAAVQLEDFYLEICSPLLKDVTFDYVGLLENETVTETKFDTFTKGKEFIITGKINEIYDDTKEFDVIINGQGNDAAYQKKLRLCFQPPIIPELPQPPIALPLFNDTVNEILPEIPPLIPEDCIPIPTPNPQEPRSESQNFIERLWAYKTINQLLSDKPSETEEKREELEEDNEDEIENDPVQDLAEIVDDLPKKQSRKEKAIKIALKYNFVTSVTSLVVVKPQEGNETETKKETVELESTNTLRSSLSNSYHSITSYSGNSYQPRPVLLSGPPGPQRKRKPTRNRIIGGSSMAFPRIGSRPNQGIFSRTSLSSSQGIQNSGSAPSGPPAVSYDMYSNQNHNIHHYSCCGGAANHATHNPYQTTTMRTSWTSLRTSCQGSVSLYGSGYLRGTNITLTDDEDDLGQLGFDDRLFSLEVRGDCCWKVFTEIGFQGQMMSFNEGQYKSPSAIRKVLKKASSVQKSVYC